MKKFILITVAALTLAACDNKLAEEQLGALITAVGVGAVLVGM